MTFHPPSKPTDTALFPFADREIRMEPDDVGLRALPHDLRRAELSRPEPGVLCTVVVDADLVRGQSLAHSVRASVAAVHLTTPGELDEVLRLITPDAIVLSARDSADALRHLPTIRAHLAGLSLTVPLLCCLWHVEDLGVRPLLASLGADIVLTRDRGEFELTEALRSTTNLTARARDRGMIDALHTMLAHMSEAAIVYDAAWRPVACNSAAQRLVYSACGTRREPGLDLLDDLFQGQAREAITQMVDLFRGDHDTTTQHVQTALGVNGRTAIPVDVRATRLPAIGEERHTLVCFRDTRTSVDRGLVERDSVTGSSKGEFLGSLKAITETLVRTFEFRTRDGGERYPGGVNEGGLLGEAHALVQLIEALDQDLAADQECLLALDSLVEQHALLLSKGLARRHDVQYEPPAAPIVVLGRPGALRRALSLSCEAVNPERAHGGSLRVSVHAEAQQAVVAVTYVPKAMQLGLPLEHPGESRGRAELVLDEISRSLAPFRGWVSRHVDTPNATTLRLHLPAALS